MRNILPALHSENDTIQIEKYSRFTAIVIYHLCAQKILVYYFELHP